MWCPGFHPGCNAPAQNRYWKTRQDQSYEDGPGGNDLAVRLQGHVERVTTFGRTLLHDEKLTGFLELERAICLHMLNENLEN